MGNGYGIYIKIDNTIIKDNTIFNISDSFLVFFYHTHLNYENEKKTNNNKILFLKIYDRNTELHPIILGQDKQLYTIGRGKSPDITINDTML